LKIKRFINGPRTGEGRGENQWAKKSGDRTRFKKRERESETEMSESVASNCCGMYEK